MLTINYVLNESPKYPDGVLIQTLTYEYNDCGFTLAFINESSAFEYFRYHYPDALDFEGVLHELHNGYFHVKCIKYSDLVRDILSVCDSSTTLKALELGWIKQEGEK
jgi:hypothetical protein